MRCTLGEIADVLRQVSGSTNNRNFHRNFRVTAEAMALINRLTSSKPSLMLTKSTWLLSLVTLFVVLISFRGKFYSSQPPSNHSGAPDGEGLCSDCHGNLNNGGGSVTITGLPSSFQPGQTYPFSVAISHPTTRGRWGFEVNARNAANNPVGTFSSTNPNAALNGGPAEISHFGAVSFTGTSYTYSNLFWTAPSTIGTGDNSVTFYVAGNAANGNGAPSGDFIYTNTRLFPLPITLKTVNYKLVDEYKVQINWVTASETASKEFAVEKSDDNTQFYPVGTVPAAGQSSVEKAYSFTDSRPSLFDQPVYYRLKLVDRDGGFKYSETLQVVLKGKAGFVHSLTPNPAKDFVVAAVQSNEPRKATVTIVSGNGSIMTRRAVQLQKGINTVRMPVTGFPQGTYLFSLQTGERIQTIRFAVL